MRICWRCECFFPFRTSNETKLFSFLVSLTPHTRARARPTRRKKERITKLKKKAAFRNPDEFYHKMSSSTTAGGVHKQGTAAKDRNSKSFIDEEEINADIRALAHTQDMSYVQMKRMQEIKKIEKLEAGLHCLGEEFEGSEVKGRGHGKGRGKGKAKSPTHTIFFDSQEEVQSFSAAKHFDTEEELAGRKHNRPRKKDLRSKEFAKATIVSQAEAIGSLAAEQAHTKREAHEYLHPSTTTGAKGPAQAEGR